jgi:serine/threonine protein kinase
MHEKKIVHRDIKPDNILLNSKESDVLDIRLGDLGLATLLKKDEQLM